MYVVSFVVSYVFNTDSAKKHPKRDKNEEKMHFLFKKFGHFKKKQYFCSNKLTPLPVRTARLG